MELTLCIPYELNLFSDPLSRTSRISRRVRAYYPEKNHAEWSLGFRGRSLALSLAPAPLAAAEHSCTPQRHAPRRAGRKSRAYKHPIRTEGGRRTLPARYTRDIRSNCTPPPPLRAPILPVPATSTNHKHNHGRGQSARAAVKQTIK